LVGWETTKGDNVRDVKGRGGRSQADDLEKAGTCEGRENL